MPLSPPDGDGMGTPSLHGGLIGRDRELAILLLLLRGREDRLITVTGPGGVGKTRLALHTAQHFDVVAEGESGSTTVVALAALSDPTLLLQAIGTALGVNEVSDQGWHDALVEAMAGRRLLVLDNCEHLSSTGAVVSDLLSHCTDLVVLATSRAPLGIYGEREFPLAPLPVPVVSRLPPLDDLARQPAVALFMRQGRLVDPTFALDRTNAGTIAEICRRLDGLPLALELAAARVRTLPPAALLDRLDRRLSILTGGPNDRPQRQRTLSDAIAWSYDLLAVTEQQFFRYLAVFPGNWTLTAAESVAGSGKVDVLDGIETLARHSLVRRRVHPQHVPGFAMLESIREFGLERLVSHNEESATRDRHAQYFAGFVRDLDLDLLLGNAQDERLSMLDWDVDNLRAALTWLLEGADVEAGLRLAGSLWPFWELRGHWVEGRRWLERAIALAGDAAPDVRGRLTLGNGVFALRHGDYALAGLRLEETLAIARQLGDEILTAVGLFALGSLARERPDSDNNLAIAHFETALSIFRARGHQYWVGRVVNNLGNIALTQGKGTHAAAHFQEALALAREFGSTWGIAGALGNLARALLVQGELERAEAALRDCLAISRELDSRHVQSDALETLARIALERERPEHAVRLWGAAEGVRAALGRVLPGPDHAARIEIMATVRRRLGDVTFETAWSSGQAAALTDTLDEVLEGSTSSSVVSATSSPRTTDLGVNLTPREREILQLLVEGHSNQEIGDALFISQHTAAKHVANILGKLGLESRTAVATYALRAGLVDH